MADTTFVAGTPIVSAWLNDVNDVVYGSATRDGRVINVKDPQFGAVGSGVVSDTAAIQAAFDYAAANDIGNIYFPSGTYLLTNPNDDDDYTCAVIIESLYNCHIYGAKDTKFTVNTTGVGSAEFGMFRIEQCQGLTFSNFEMDGSGITITGLGANRSRGFVAVNYDVNNKATDLAVLNKRLTFRNINAHDIGGFVGIPPRSAALAATPYTDIVSVHDCIGSGFTGQDHYVGFAYTRNVHVYNNRVLNELTALGQIGNLFCDLSTGCENGMVENNYAYGFTGGAKAETHTLAGPGGNEDRPSKDITFRNNVFEQIGDPVTVVFPGPSGGGWYGIKMNGINHSAYGNTIIGRSLNMTTGGLYQGIQLVNTSVVPVDSIHTVEGNSITGTIIGINHDVLPADTTYKYLTYIEDNKIYDMILPTSQVDTNDGAGIIASKNVRIKNNSIYRTPYAAISLNAADQSIVSDNTAYDCVTVDQPTAGVKVVYVQEESGASGYFEFTNNKIIDSRGGSAAEYGYYFGGGLFAGNKYVFTPGYTQGLVTGVAFDQYTSAIGQSIQLAGTLVIPRIISSLGSPSATAPFSTQAWNVGDRAIRSVPVVGQPKAWLCTVAGTPGTWVSEGVL